MSSVIGHWVKIVPSRGYAYWAYVVDGFAVFIYHTPYLKVAIEHYNYVRDREKIRSMSPL